MVISSSICLRKQPADRPPHGRACLAYVSLHGPLALGKKHDGKIDEVNKKAMHPTLEANQIAVAVVVACAVHLIRGRGRRGEGEGKGKG